MRWICNFPVAFPCIIALCRSVVIIFSYEKVIYKHIYWFILDAVPLFSTPIRANRAGESHSSCVDVTGISDSGEQREPDPWHSRSQLFDQGRVVRKPVNANPGLNVHRSIIFSWLKMFSPSNIWCSLEITTA